MATNNIEKLYELAGVEKYYLYTVKHLGKIHIAPLEGILENKHLNTFRRYIQCLNFLTAL